MTQPDQFKPTQAANYSSLSTWANRTQQDWENSLRGQEVNRWGNNGVLGGLFQGLQQNKPFMVALVEAILHNGFHGEAGENDGPFDNATQALLALRNRFTSKWADAKANRKAVRATTVTDDTNAVTATTNIKNTWTTVIRGTTEDENAAAAPRLADVLVALRDHRHQTRQNTRDLQRLEQSRVTSLTKGTETNFNFSEQPNGDLPAEFTVSTSGPGTANIGIDNGVACWRNTNNANKTARILCEIPTDTDYQVLRGTMSTPPQPGSTGGTPKFWALARVSEDGNSYVWARGYADNVLSYKGEIGYTIDGVDHTWLDDISLTWSLDMTLKAGIGTNPREYQVWSGGRLVTTYSETGTSSLCGNTWTISRGSATSGTFTLTYDGATTSAINYNATAASVVAALTALGKGTWNATGASPAGGPWLVNPPAGASESLTLTGTGALTGGTLTLTQTFNRRWGAIAELRSGVVNPRHSGKISGVSVADDRPRQVYGSTARMYRSGTGNVSLAGGGNITAIPDEFFSGILYESGDINATTVDGTFTVTEEKSYVIVGRVLLSNSVLGSMNLVLQVWDGSSWSATQFGSVTVASNDESALYGSWIQYLKAGQKVRLATLRSGISVNVLTGESTGAQTYFSITGAG